MSKKKIVKAPPCTKPATTMGVVAATMLTKELKPKNQAAGELLEIDLAKSKAIAKDIVAKAIRCVPTSIARGKNPKEIGDISKNAKVVPGTKTGKNAMSKDAAKKLAALPPEAPTKPCTPSMKHSVMTATPPFKDVEGYYWGVYHYEPLAQNSRTYTTDNYPIHDFSSNSWSFVTTGGEPITLVGGVIRIVGMKKPK